VVAIAARVLIADDERTFAESTADLLRREGFACDVVGDALEARRALARDEFDVLIADLRMPGNLELEFLREVPALAPGMPVIVVTAFPTLDSAVAAVELPVTGYLLKPLDVTALLDRVRAVVGHRRAVRAVDAQRARLESWIKELDHVSEAMRAPPQPAAPAPASVFASLTLQHVAGTLAELRAVDATPAAVDPCLLAGCPQRLALVGTLREVIDVLQRTKGSFKSKELAALRRKVEVVVARAST
jgi:DNA-binding response OmpR family regulator